MKILKLTVFLAVVSALAGGVLAYVNDLTAPIIADQAMAAEKASLEVIFPGGDFTALDYEDETGLVTSAYVAKGEGYVFKSEVIGYNSSTPVTFMMGIDNDGNIVGFEVLSQQETNGLGSKVADPEFKAGVVGKTVNDSVDMISGATVTSKAVIGGINAIKEVYADAAGVEVSTEEPVAPAKDPVTLNDDYSANKAVVISEADGVFTIESTGFQGVNTFEVAVADGAVVSVKMTGFNDTPGIGDTVNDTYFATLAGATLESEVDVVAGATYTSKSALAAVQLALKPADAAEDTEKTEDETAVSGPLFEAEGATITAEADGVYTVEATGFHGDNVFEVTIADGAVVSVVMTGFNDTPGIGDLVNEEYLAKFAGVTEVNAADVVSGATFTSKSAQAAVQAALDYAATKE